MEIEEELLLDDNQDEKPQQRPPFLTVLCILTYVGAGFGIIGGLIGLIAMSATSETYESLSEFGDPSISEPFENAMRWSKISQLLALLGSALCLIGALFMWRLKKIGYYIYIPGQILPLIGSFMTMNSFAGGTLFAGFGMVAIGISFIFPLAFIIMYGVNLKYMK